MPSPKLDVSVVRRAWSRVLSIFNKRDLDREFEDEALSHIALATEDYVQRGMPLPEAQRLARLRFGSIAASQDAHRDSRGLPWLEGLFFDLRLALRGLRRDRAFALVAIAMLALAIALNTTVFTVMDAMLFRGFPHVQRNDRLLFLQERYRSGVCCMSYADFEDWRREARSFQGMALVGGQAIAFRDDDGRPVDMRAITASANLFGLLGVPPMLGRDFAPADGTSRAPQVAILSHRLWSSRFGRRADIVGGTAQINGAPATIIGVMPERFEFPMPASGDLWMPVVPTPDQLRRGLTPGSFTAVGRLRDGVTRQQALAELEAINLRLADAYPETNRGLIPTAIGYSQFVSGEDAPLIWGSLWVGAWFVLLIACANVANLMLVRTIGRWREFATRMALGAGQWRMIRQMLAESLTLVSVAGVLGWWITNWSMRQWAAATESRYQVVDYTVNSGMLAYLVAISVAAALLLSVAPIGRVVQLGVGGALKGDARGVTQGRRGKHLAAGLVAGQMALAIVLLSGAGVLMRSLVAIVSAESGVRDPENILVGVVRLSSDSYPTPDSRLAYFDRLEAQLRIVPGVEDAAVSSVRPVRGVNSRQFEIDGRPTRPEERHAVQFVSAGTDYFRVVGAPALSGRTFTDDDRASGRPVAIVNQSFAARYWPGDQPQGKRLRTMDRNTPGEWRVVVGVVPNIMQGDALRQEFKPLVYVPFRQTPPAAAAYFLARTRVPPEQVAQAVRTAVQALDADVSLESYTTLKASFAFERDFMDPEHSELGKHATVAPVFAVIALLLAAIGLFAVIAHSVTQRTKEIGVRIAIGAAARDISRMVLREGMLPVAMGMGLGLAASLAVNRVLQSQLVGVSPYDPMTMAGAPVVLTVVALLACQIPARRAMHVDPVIALRHE